MKSIIVTADDLGLDPYINKGIVDAYQNGIITCSALLMNAPATEEGITIARGNPGLEVGIHLSIVEGYSLRNVASTITEIKPYFDSGICLKRNWSEFVKCYLMGRIDLNELEEEFELQIRKFKSNFDSIPFLNSTQHMHLLPGIWKIVLKLCKTHGIKYIRLPRLTFPDRLWFNKRILYIFPFSLLGSYCRLSLKNTGIQSADNVVGMQFSGNISAEKLKFILSHLGHGVNEIVLHPGFKSQYLINHLPSSYSNFEWEEELKASTSREIKDFIAQNKIQLLRFSNLKP
jgi:chitin disaccharide deacetylase